MVQGTEREEQIMKMTRNNVQLASGLRPGTALCRIIKGALVIALLIAAAAINSVNAQTSVLQGTISVSAGNGPAERVLGANVNLTPATPGQAARSTDTNDQGEFKFTDVVVGLYTLKVACA